MTDTQKLRELLAKATPGPWALNDDDTISLASGEKTAWRQAHRANCALIVAAVNALPELLNEVERLRAEMDRMREALEKISERHVPDQPAADGSDEADYVRKHHTNLRRIARAALGETK